MKKAGPGVKPVPVLTRALAFWEREFIGFSDHFWANYPLWKENQEWETVHEKGAFPRTCFQLSAEI